MKTRIVGYCYVLQTTDPDEEVLLFQGSQQELRKYISWYHTTNPSSEEIISGSHLRVAIVGVQGYTP